MAYRYGNRHQMILLPQSIEEYVTEDDSVRAYDAFVESLNYKALGIDINPHQVGNSQYDPKAMLKLLVYGYSYGVKSSRKLERETQHNMAFIWLMGGLKPDHKTIAEFRRNNKKSIQQVLKQCARMCIKLNLIAGNVLFVDGTKIRANASASRTHEKVWYQKQLKKVDQRIKQLLQECERLDQQEQNLDSFVAMDKKLSKTEALKSTIQDVLSEFENSERKKINQTDPDCANMRSIQGKHASYNVQSVVDDKNGLIVHAEAVNDTSDLKQLARQINQANAVLTEPCEDACADAGYADVDELEKIDAQEIGVIVPSKRQAQRKAPEPFNKQTFKYDKEQDCYFCPEGHRLKLSTIEKKTGGKRYLIEDKNLCFNCRHWGICTTSKNGRRTFRSRNEDLIEKFEARYNTQEAQSIYATRKTLVEHPFGHMKRNLKTDAFMMRGREGVQAETSLLATCYNLVRMMNTLGVCGLMRKLSAQTEMAAAG
jgi:transposase